MNDVRQLRAELEALPHELRLRRLIDLGRSARSDGASAEMVRTLAQGDWTDRLWALKTCFGSRDGATALQALADRSRIIRASAVQVVGDVLDDVTAIEALARLRGRARARLVRHLHDRKRHGPIDACVESLAKDDPRACAALLPYATAETVRRHQARAKPFWDTQDWHRLGAMHPDLTLQALHDEADGCDRLPSQFPAIVGTVLEPLARQRPDAALALLDSLAGRMRFEDLDLAPLLAARPADVASRVLDGRLPAQTPLARRATALPASTISALVSSMGPALGGRGRASYSQRRGQRAMVFPARGRADAPLSYLRRMPANVRADVIAGSGTAWRRDDDPAVMALYPPDLRASEARRRLSMPELGHHPTVRLAFAALLPWEEANDFLFPYLRNPDAQLRGAASGALIAATRFQRERLNDVVERAFEHRNEQAPVREHMLNAFGELPPRMWTATTLATLDRFLRHLRDAVDHSSREGYAIRRLVAQLLPFHPAWAAGWIEALAETDEFPEFPDLENRLSDRDMPAIIEAFAPLASRWVGRGERVPHLIALARALGRRCLAYPALLDHLEAVVKSSTDAFEAERALEVLHEVDRARFARLVPDLVAADESWMLVRTVHQFAHRKRPDLLTPHLVRESFVGRFADHHWNGNFVFSFREGFHRWTTPQQAIFGRYLDGVEMRRARHIGLLVRVLRQLAAMPIYQLGRLERLAEEGNPHPLTRSTALRGLAWLDDNGAVDYLLGAMADDRARVAIHALRRPLMEMAPDDAVRLLADVGTTKVTVAKEVVRLLGDLPGKAAEDALASWIARPKHRDVQVALLRAAWSHLGDERFTDLIVREAGSPDEAIATMVGRTPLDGHLADGTAWISRMFSNLLRHDQATVRQAAIERLIKGAPVAGEEIRAILLGLMFSAFRNEAHASAKAYFHALADSAGVAIALERIGPNRRAQASVTEALGSCLEDAPQRFLPFARVLLERLEADPPTAALRMELAARYLPLTELGDYIEHLAGRGELHFDAFDECQSGFAYGRRDQRAELEAFEARLRRSPDERLRRLGLEALKRCAREPGGWQPSLRETLACYREDPSPWVAGEAQFTFTGD